MISFSFSLSIIPGPNGGSVEIPGCESESVVSRATLLTGCCTSHITVNAIKEVIPNVEIVSLSLGRLGHGTNFLRFPSEIIGGCHCGQRNDWFKILKDIGCNTVPNEEIT